MLTLWNQFDDLFANDDFFKWPARAAERRFLPAVDIQETQDSYLLRADVPGVPADAIDISVKDGVLTVTGERQSERKTSEAGYHRVERAYGRFQRSFALPKGVHSEGIEARVDNGVLTVTIPKPVAAVPHKIEVKTGDAPALVTEGEKKAS